MHQRWLTLSIVLLLLVAAAAFFAPTARAGGPGDAAPPAQVENQVCLTCHANANLSVKLPSGETLSLFTDAVRFNASVHGKQGQCCTACHSNISGYPHPPIAAKDVRDFSLQMYTLCKQCHDDKYKLTLDSMHAQALAGGNRNAPVCTDCHTAHYVSPPDQPRTKISQTCSRCHGTIYAQYKDSVHGAALIGEGNPDVPSCTDCHGVHNIEDPRTVKFRLKSPYICARCHADEKLMSKYKLSTAVFRTYVADLHGTTIQLFPLNSDTPPRQAVCFDCHGIHDIRKTDDPKATVVRENLVKTCRQCHPDATENFPAAWVSHYEPTRDEFPQIYLTELFFGTLTASVMLALMGHIFLDFGRLVVKKWMGAAK